MKIAVRLSPANCRLWLTYFKTMVEEHGGIDLYCIKEPTAIDDHGLASLLALEKMLVRRGRVCGSDPLPMADLDWPVINPADADWIIDLTDLPSLPQLNKHTLRPRYNGITGEMGIVDAYFQTGSPQITIDHGGHGLAEGVASLEAATGIGGAMEAVFSRVSMLFLRVLTGVPTGVSGGVSPSVSVTNGTARPLSTATKVRHIAGGLARHKFRG